LHIDIGISDTICAAFCRLAKLREFREMGVNAPTIDAQLQTRLLCSQRESWDSGQQA
jgi:hypothetical protein